MPKFIDFCDEELNWHSVNADYIVSIGTTSIVTTARTYYVNARIALEVKNKAKDQERPNIVPDDHLQEVKAFLAMTDSGWLRPDTPVLYRFAYHLVRTGDTDAINLFASRYEKYVFMARDAVKVVTNG